LVYDPDNYEKEEVSDNENEKLEVEKERDSGLDSPQEPQEVRQRLMKKTHFKISSLARKKGVLPRILKKIKEVTDIKSIYPAKYHTLVKGDSRVRRDCIGCKIAGKRSRPGGLQAN
jgi:hypothetical protein